MDQGSSSNNIFDFNSQAGVMSLLAAIRLSSLSPVDKNELRDLVFLYTNGGGDVSVRIALEQKLVSHKIQPPAPKTTTPPAQMLSFGSSRPAPVFRTPTSQPIPTPAVAEAPVVAPTSIYVPVAAPVPMPTAVATPAPSSIPVATPASYAPVVAERPQAIPVEPAPAAAPTSGGVNYLDRIREIKAAVNSKVGNPVNLVDINNEVGREYMNALLDAMKRLSGGVAGGIDVAMQRLEAAYQTVEVAVAAHNQNEASLTPVSPTTATNLPVDPVVPIPEASPVATPKPVENTLEPVVVLETTDNEIPSPQISEVPTDFSGPSGFDTLYEATTAHTTTPTPSLADEERVHTLNDLPAPESIATSESGDLLKTREIDDGLNQLLSDWSLFKKSGLFGTGPKGIEHPLFKKLAGLQIPLVLAGRFEGSTQEIKQSITDYMNGWRYEQGIIYEQGETFEHYLRRVIKQILDLQKKRRSA